MSHRVAARSRVLDLFVRELGSLQGEDPNKIELELLIGAASQGTSVPVTEGQVAELEARAFVFERAAAEGRARSPRIRPRGRAL